MPIDIKEYVGEGNIKTSSDKPTKGKKVVKIDEIKKRKKRKKEVVMVGKGLRLQNGEFSGMDIQPGMRVVYEPYAGKTFYENDMEYLIVKEPDIVMQV